MRNIETGKKAQIFIMGFFISLIVLLMVWGAFARFINDYIVDLFSGNNVLLLIILGLQLISLGVAVGVGILLTDDVSKKSVLKASLMSFILTLAIIIGISYFVLAILYPEIFSEVKGFEFIGIFPSVIMYFSIYVLKNPFTVYILTILIYYLLFVVFLEDFYEYENRYSYEDLISDLNFGRF